VRRAELLLRLLAHFKSVGEPWPWPDDIRLFPLHTGRHQKAAGAWSWCLARASDGHNEPMWGSTWPATTIARAPAVELSMYNWGDRHLDPVDAPTAGDKT